MYVIVVTSVNKYEYIRCMKEREKHMSNLYSGPFVKEEVKKELDAIVKEYPDFAPVILRAINNDDLDMQSWAVCFYGKLHQYYRGRPEYEYHSASELSAHFHEITGWTRDPESSSTWTAIDTFGVYHCKELVDYLQEVLPSYEPKIDEYVMPERIGGVSTDLMLRELREGIMSAVEYNDTILLRHAKHEIDGITASLKLVVDGAKKYPSTDYYVQQLRKAVIDMVSEMQFHDILPENFFMTNGHMYNNINKESEK